MKVKVSVPTEPVCTIKLEIDEARALLAGLTQRNDIAPAEAVNAVGETLKQALAKELHISLEINLFEQEGKPGKPEEEPPQIEGGKDDE